jgi:hypothetical protein
MENIFDRKLFDTSRVGGNVTTTPYKNYDATGQELSGIEGHKEWYNQQLTPEGWDKRINRERDFFDTIGGMVYPDSEVNMRSHEELTRQAIENLKAKGIPLTTSNLNNEIDKIANNRRFTQVTSNNAPSNQKEGIETLLPEEEPPVTPTASDPSSYEQRPDESLEDFAARIGINLNNKPYSNWDYIRDMSAGLLQHSRDDGTFFGALGPAATKTNAAMREAERDEKQLRNKLAIAKWKSDEEWQKDIMKLNAAEKLAKLKASKLELKGKPIIIDDGRGTKTTAQLITGDYRLVPEHMRIWSGGRPFYKTTEENNAVMLQQRFDSTKDFNTTVSDYVKTENMQSMLDQFALGTSYGGVMISRLRDSDDYDDLMTDFREGTSKLGQRLADLMDDKNADPDDISKLVLSLRDNDAVEAAIKRKFMGGLYSQVLPSEKTELAQVIGKEARRAGGEAITNDPWEYQTPMDYITAATADIMGNAKWGLEPGDPAKFNPTQTEYDLQKFKSGWDTLTGEDDSDELLNTRLFNLAEYTPNHSLYGTKGGKHPLKGSMFTDSQWELLKPEHKKAFFNDGSALSAKLQRDYGYTQKRADEDVMSSFIDSNAIRGGADNFLVWNDYESSYTKPKQWFVEPDGYTDATGKHHTIDELRKEKITWNGIIGEWYKFIDVDTDTPRRISISRMMKEQGVTWPNIEAIKF